MEQEPSIEILEVFADAIRQGLQVDGLLDYDDYAVYTYPQVAGVCAMHRCLNNGYKVRIFYLQRRRCWVVEFYSQQPDRMEVLFQEMYFDFNTVNCDTLLHLVIQHLLGKPVDYSVKL